MTDSHLIAAVLAYHLHRLGQRATHLSGAELRDLFARALGDEHPAAATPDAALSAALDARGDLNRTYWTSLVARRRGRRVRRIRLAPLADRHQPQEIDELANYVR